jgi:hypothetical protein
MVNSFKEIQFYKVRKKLLVFNLMAVSWLLVLSTPEKPQHEHTTKKPFSFAPCRYFVALI